MDNSIKVDNISQIILETAQDRDYEFWLLVMAVDKIRKKYQPAVTLSKQMIVREFFMICFRNNDPCIYTAVKPG